MSPFARPSPSYRKRPNVVAALLPVCLLLAAGTAIAAVYRYKDANGNWVYTDRPGDGAGQAQSVAIKGAGASSPNMTVVPRSSDTGVVLVARNDCRCPVEFAVKAQTAAGQKAGRVVVPPQSEAPLLEISAGDAPTEVRYEYGYVVGDPTAVHRPARPYRAPFALAQNFRITQAAPDTVTHRDAGSRYAVDIAMPIGTAVHAAREGVVVDVARTHFRGGLQPKDVDQANFVQILHDDGTYAIYAHLQLDTVRVRPGQRVARGEYVANSGNTGYSSGPHLHFVVLRNAGLRSESVPVTFAGPGGVAVTPRSGEALAAH